MIDMTNDNLKPHLTRLFEGYKAQLTQLEAGLEQMLVQQEQTTANIPLIENEISNVKGFIEEMKQELGIEEEE
jgi:hypothetical protein